jgi:hypothetical protein
MMSVEALVSIEALVADGPTGMAAPEPVAAPTLTANGRMAGPSDGKHDRQCGERHERQFRMCKLLHGDASLSTSTHWDGCPSRTIHPAGQHHRHALAIVFQNGTR